MPIQIIVTMTATRIAVFPVKNILVGGVLCAGRDGRANKEGVERIHYGY